jgi:hypothetical protein
MPEMLKEDLAHVIWMGGSPCAGKSSIAESLSSKYHLYFYRCDDHFQEHQSRIIPDKHPAFHTLTGLTWDQIWMRPVPIQVAAEIDIYREEFGMIVEDLLALPKSIPILAEGAALLPDCVSEILLNRRQAIWIVPTEPFQRTHYARRTWIHEILSQCRDPRQAFQNWMDRDVAFAKWVAERAAELELELITVNGALTIVQNTEIVEKHFQLLG